MDEAEAKMLRLTCERADLQDGQDILELGCGWGSLTLWMAEHYPNSNNSMPSPIPKTRRSLSVPAQQKEI